MNLFILGAGRPSSGITPSALRAVTKGVTALDWNLRVFEKVTQLSNVHFAGGYQFADVAAQYPGLVFTVIQNWKHQSPLHSFFSMPLSEEPSFLIYSDTIYRSDVVALFDDDTMDVQIGIDTFWRTRFAGRSEQDMECAETVHLDAGEVAEFAGIIKLNSTAMSALLKEGESEIGSSILDLVNWLIKSPLRVRLVDLKGQWAEFNAPDDVARFVLGTKAETLARLMPLVKKSSIGDQYTFTLDDWAKDPDAVTSNIANKFDNSKVIVRSSSGDEDGWENSHAGGFDSVGNVDTNKRDAIIDAVVAVVDSYGSTARGHHQVLVQEFLENVKSSGVIFTCGLETGAPYYRINFDDKTSSTSSVTDGTADGLRTVLVNRDKFKSLKHVEPALVPVLDAVREIERLLNFYKLDMEFAVDRNDEIYIFQIRPITVDHSDFEVKRKSVSKRLKLCKAFFKASQKPSPSLSGNRTFYANMPDWNPAEIIGTRPKPLAFSLYQRLITNDIWAQQRAEFGYQDNRPAPLIYSFVGQPYVDVRATLNSFIPAGLSSATTDRIVSAYLTLFENNPQFHDKIEFEVAFTVWTPDYQDIATSRFAGLGVTSDDIKALGEKLKQLTAHALTRLSDDIASIDILSARRSDTLDSSETDIQKAYALLYDCREYGTLAFSHAARAGFVAKTLLNSMVSLNVLKRERADCFLRSIDTVAGDFENQKAAVNAGKSKMNDLVSSYGHLRPGTYDITIPAYWEDPEFYIDVAGVKERSGHATFQLTHEEAKSVSDFITGFGVDETPETLFQYIRDATVAREAVKFEFTKNLSSALDHIRKFLHELGIGRQDSAFLTYSDIEDLRLGSLPIKLIKKRIGQRRGDYTLTQLVELPPVIRTETDFDCFERMSTQPNFVTTKRVAAEVIAVSAHEKRKLSGKIALIPQADPGYDWLFGHNIAGLVTKYGGANSHMAIRAAELGLPAAIGVGEKYFEYIQGLKRVEMDCASQTIRDF